LKEKNLANATVYSYIRYVKILFNFLVEEDYIFKSPFRKKLMPKVIHHPVIIFEDNDLIEILDEAKKRDNHYYNCLVLLLMECLL
jgi:site-specific recombinase XerD